MPLSVLFTRLFHSKTRGLLKSATVCTEESEPTCPAGDAKGKVIFFTPKGVQRRHQQGIWYLLYDTDEQVGGSVEYLAFKFLCLYFINQIIP